MRQQADSSEEPGEQSISPFDLWRRSVASWHLGAGQEWADLADSARERFRISKGLDVWTKGKLQLLPDTGSRRSSTNTNLRLVSAGSRLYLTDGNSVLYTTDITVGSPTWTAVTGTPASSAVGIASDGFNVWIAYGTNGVYKTDTGTGAAASYATGTVGGPIGYVKARLMAANDNSIYNITASGALPAALFTHANSDFRWVGFAEGQKNIYAAGFSGDRSLIYRTAVKADGTALDAPVVAGELPDGEIVRSIQGYLGFVLIGTDKGVRFATASTDGDLTLGALISTSARVDAFEPQDAFVWFSWKNYDSSSTGLGRLDLRSFVAPNTPAYTTDLMAAAQGDVQSIASFQNQRVFTVSGTGVFTQTTNKVASGELRTGKVNYRLTAQKVYKYVDVSYESPPAGAKLARRLDVDGTLTAEVDTTITGSRVRYDAGSKAGENAEIVLKLSRATDNTLSPVVTRITLRALPIPPRGEQIVLPLILEESVETENDSVRVVDPKREYDALKLLERDGLPLACQIGDETFEAFIDSVELGPDLRFSDDWLRGTCTVTLRKFDS